MSQKSALKNRPERRKPTDDKAAPSTPSEAVLENEQDDNDLVEKIRPYMSTIGLVVVAVVLGAIAWAVYQSSNFQNEAVKWTDLNQAMSINMATSDVKELTRIADDYADSKAGLIGALYAADSQMRQGIEQLPVNPKEALTLVQKAKENYQTVVDADDRLKTAWLSERALFNLAYASETLGEFQQANKLYQELVDNAPESPLALSAKRALERVKEPELAALFEKYKDYETKVIGDAPGPSVTDPNRPSGALNEFDNVELPPGEVPPTGENNSGGQPEMNQPADGQGGEESNAGDGSAEKPAEEKPAEEKGGETEAGKQTGGENVNGKTEGESNPPAETNPPEGEATETPKTDNPPKEDPPKEETGSGGSEEGQEGGQ